MKENGMANNSHVNLRLIILSAGLAQEQVSARRQHPFRFPNDTDR